MLVFVEPVELNTNVNKIIERQEQNRCKLIDQSKSSHESNYPSRSILRSLNRLIITYLARFHRMSLLDLPPWVKSSNRGDQPFRQKLKRYLIESLRRRDDSGQFVLLGWPNLLLLIYLCCVSYLSVIVVIEWSYEVQKIKLKHLMQWQRASTERQELIESGQVLIMKVYEDCLRNKTEQIRKTLKSLGASHIEWSIVVECLHFYAILASLVSYLLGPFLLNYNELKYFPIVRYFLDQTSAIKLRAETVRLELNKFIESSRCFANSQLSLYYGIESAQTSQQKVLGQDKINQEPEREITNLSQIVASDILCVSNSEQAYRHHTTVEHLEKIILQGRLKSTNRDPVSLDNYALFNLIFFIFTFSYSGLRVANYYGVLDQFFASATYPPEFGLKYAASVFAYYLMMAIVLHSFAYFGILNTLNVGDQFEAIETLRAEIHKLIEQNEAYSYQLMRAHNRIRHAPEANRANVSKFEVIDLNLLTLIVRYKLFHREYMQMKTTFTALATGYIIIVLSLPIAIRLAMAYIDPRLRQFAIELAFAALIPAYLGLALLCHLHTRFLKIYRALSSLLVQLISFSLEPQLAYNLNYQFIELILRRELAHPHKFLHKFAIEPFGAPMTYGNIMGIVFWFSVIMLSLFENVDSIHKRDIFSALRTDPFGLTSLSILTCN